MGWGEFIVKVRKRAKLTQTQLAEKLEVHPGTISRWENNRLEPNYAQLDMLLDKTLHCRMVDCLLLPDEATENAQIQRLIDMVAERMEAGRVTPRKSGAS